MGEFKGPFHARGPVVGGFYGADGTLAGTVRGDDMEAPRIAERVATALNMLDGQGAAPAAPEPAPAAPEHEDRAERILRAAGFREELGGGGCTFLSLYLCHGVHIWATCIEGGGMPTESNFHLCVYAPTADGGTTESLASFRSDDGGHIGAVLTKARRIAECYDNAADWADALMKGADDPPADDGPEFLNKPQGFEEWSDGIAQGFYLRRFAGPNEGFVIFSCRDGQDNPRPDSWAIMAGVGNLDGGEFQRLLELRDFDGIGPDKAVEMSIAAVEAARAFRADCFTLDGLSRRDLHLIHDGLVIIQPDGENDEKRAAELAAHVDGLRASGKIIRYSVDGHEFPNEDSALAGDGGFAPFRVFDIPAQTYVPGVYPTREAAQAIADHLNG